MGWTVNGVSRVLTDRRADRVLTSHYDRGDLFHNLRSGDNGDTQQHASDVCDQGMATAASLFDFTTKETHFTVRVPATPE